MVPTGSTEAYDPTNHLVFIPQEYGELPVQTFSYKNMEQTHTHRDTEREKDKERYTERDTEKKKKKKKRERKSPEEIGFFSPR